MGHPRLPALTLEDMTLTLKDMNNVRGDAVALYSGATVSGSVEVDLGEGNNTLLLIHTISALPATGATGGFARVRPKTNTGGVSVPHHGEGSSIPTANTVTSYAALWKNLSRYVDVALDVGNGTHDVTAIPIKV